MGKDKDQFLCHTQMELFTLMNDHEERVKQYIMHSSKTLVEEHQRVKNLAGQLQDALWGTTWKDSQWGQTAWATLSVMRAPLLCRPKEDRRCKECVDCLNVAEHERRRIRIDKESIK